MDSIKYEPISHFQWSSKDPSDQFAVVNPATGATITTIQGGGLSEVNSAVAAAKQAFTSWRWQSPQSRSQLLHCAGALLSTHAPELAHLLSLENGKPVSQALQADIPLLVASFHYFASLCDKLPADLYDRGLIYASVLREPYGVVAAILPFNWPPIHTGAKAAPALAAGNTVVLKPGEQAPLTVLRVVELLQSVFPPGVVAAIPAAGPAVPQALVAHPDVRKVSFTGSTRAGAAVGRAAAETITPLSLELGGKNAFIVFEDADVELAARDALDGGFFNQGEACTAAARVLVQERMHDAFVRKLAQAVGRLRVGSGLDEETHVGPLVTGEQQRRVEEYIRVGVEEGAVIAAQAPLPSGPALRDGFFVKPTLFTDVTREMRIAREEIFGPVVTVTRFESYAEAIEIANESEYGLVCGVYTRDMTKALRAAREIDVGMVFVNNYNRNFLGTPFGGAKHSGYGREHCIETLKEYTRAKAIRIPSGLGEVRSWGKWEGIFDGEGNDAEGAEANPDVGLQYNVAR